MEQRSVRSLQIYTFYGFGAHNLQLGLAEWQLGGKSNSADYRTWQCHAIK